MVSREKIQESSLDGEGQDPVSSFQERAHGSRELEYNIGITASVSASPEGGTREKCEEVLSSRPTALFKWAFDDFIVEEVLPVSDTDNDTTTDVEKDGTTLIRIVSEGMPTGLLANHIISLLGRETKIHFLTPIDFVSCSSRYAWVRKPFEEVVSRMGKEKTFHTRLGRFFVDQVKPIPIPASSPEFPLEQLPALRYTVTLRNIHSNLAQLLPPLRSVVSNGFLNYNHVGRHGLGLHQTYNEAKFLLQRHYPDFVKSYIKSLSEGALHVSKEIATLLEVLSEVHSTEKDWKGVVEGMEYALQQDTPLLQLPQTGLYYPHHVLLQDFVRRAASLYPRHHDSAQLIKESISRTVLYEKMRSLTDVHFNASASLRWEGGGNRVQVGDLVVKNPSVRARLDPFEGAADHINGHMIHSFHPSWCHSPNYVEEAHATLFPHVQRIEREQDAAEYSIQEVVLPLYGRGVDDLPVLPQDGAFLKLAEELNITGLQHMKTAFPAGYRPLLATPLGEYGFYIFDEERQWEWEEGPQAAALKAAVYKDTDGISRIRSPLMEKSQKKMIARSGIRGREARSFFLKPARKTGATCILKMTLPRGVPVTSALREAFQFATLSPSAIYRLLR